MDVWTPESNPLDWAIAQQDLCVALQELGVREDSRRQIEQAIVACRKAVAKRAELGNTERWATAQVMLGSALARLGEREYGTVSLSEAEGALRDALQAFEAFGDASGMELARSELDRTRRLLDQRGV